MNARYLAYCKAHGKTSDEMMEHDRLVWPGGVMTGFILWNTEKLRSFRMRHPEAFLGDSLCDHSSYDTWLADNAEVTK